MQVHKLLNFQFPISYFPPPAALTSTLESPPTLKSSLSGPWDGGLGEKRPGVCAGTVDGSLCPGPVEKGLFCFIQ